MTTKIRPLKGAGSDRTGISQQNLYDGYPSFSVTEQMAQLRRELAQEKARSQELVSSVKQFRSSLNNLFDLADNP